MPQAGAPSLSRWYQRSLNSRYSPAALSWTMCACSRETVRLISVSSVNARSLRRIRPSERYTSTVRPMFVRALESAMHLELEARALDAVLGGVGFRERD